MKSFELFLATPTLSSSPLHIPSTHTCSLGVTQSFGVASYSACGIHDDKPPDVCAYTHEQMCLLVSQCKNVRIISKITLMISFESMFDYIVKLDNATIARHASQRLTRNIHNRLLAMRTSITCTPISCMIICNPFHLINALTSTAAITYMNNRIQHPQLHQTV